MYLTILGKGIYRTFVLPFYRLSFNFDVDFTEDLDTLEQLAINLYGDIEKKNVEMPYWNDPIYTEEQLATKTTVVPVKDIRMLSVNFLIPEQTKYYKSAVIIISDCFNKFKFNINYVN